MSIFQRLIYNMLAVRLRTSVLSFLKKRAVNFSYTPTFGRFLNCMGVVTHTKRIRLSQIVFAVWIGYLLSISSNVAAAKCDCDNATHLGDAGNNPLIGTSGPDIICGLGGDDNILGLGGNDCIDGGDGDDNINSGGGNDQVFGGEGDDNVVGGPGNDTIDGGGGINDLVGGLGVDTCFGGVNVATCLTDVGDLLKLNTDGVVGHYLKQVNGDVLQASNEMTTFYPASTIKVLQHLHAMRAVEAKDEDLMGTMLTVCPGTNTNCTNSPNSQATCQGAMPITETLQIAIRRMMMPSDNESTNAIQELFGNGDPSVGRDAMNDTALKVVGMMNTALEHKFACNAPPSAGSMPPFNALTLEDIGLLYEEVATNADVLEPTTREIFYSLMFNEQTDLYISSVIDQEALKLGLSEAAADAFKDEVRLAHKAGNIGTSHVSIGGWAELPLDGGVSTRQYVYGFFVDDASTNTIPSIRSVARELLREVISDALQTW